MQVRNAIVAVTVAALALTLSACSSSANPAVAPTTGDAASPGTTASARPAATAGGAIRPLQAGFNLASVSQTLRSGFPSYADKSDDEIVTILNAACDAMDANGTPQSGADAIQTFGIAAYDAAFSVTAAISLYCPEYSAFLRGDGTQSNG